MTITKLDLKHELRSLYSAPRKPVLIDVPELSFLVVHGRGDPNTTPDYQDAIQVLYSVAYTLKFQLKGSPGGFDYPVMPLESLWWTPDSANFDAEHRALWYWTAMIMQPDVVTEDLIAGAVDTAKQKRPLNAADKLALEHLCEGRAAQVMHIGPYSAEGPTIAMLHAFIDEQGLKPTGKHHEIYLGDPRRAKLERLRTIVRQPVA